MMRIDLRDGHETPDQPYNCIPLLQPWACLQFSAYQTHNHTISSDTIPNDHVLTELHYVQIIHAIVDPDL